MVESESTPCGTGRSPTVKSFQFTVRDPVAHGDTCADSGTCSPELEYGSLADTT